MSPFENPTNQTRRMLTRDPMLNALFNLSSATATHCVNVEEEDGEPARVWAENISHAESLVEALKRHNVKIIGIEEV